MRLKMIQSSNGDNRLSNVKPTHKPNGHFAKGNKLGGRKKGSENRVVKLRDLMLKTLLKPNGSNAPMIVQAMLNCTGRTPSAVLALAARMLPNDIRITKQEIAPILIAKEANINVGGTLPDSRIVEGSVVPSDNPPKIAQEGPSLPSAGLQEGLATTESPREPESL